MKWVIYCLKNPRTQEIRYVGATTQRPTMANTLIIDAQRQNGGAR